MDLFFDPFFYNDYLEPTSYNSLAPSYRRRQSYRHPFDVPYYVRYLNVDDVSDRRQKQLDANRHVGPGSEYGKNVCARHVESSVDNQALQAQRTSAISPSPRVNEYSIPIPGFNSGDVDVHLEVNRYGEPLLTVSGEKMHKQNSDTSSYMSKMSFVRTIHLPNDVTQDMIKAEMDGETLHVTVNCPSNNVGRERTRIQVQDVRSAGAIGQGESSSPDASDQPSSACHESCPSRKCQETAAAAPEVVVTQAED